MLMVILTTNPTLAILGVKCIVKLGGYGKADRYFNSVYHILGRIL